MKAFQIGWLVQVAFNIKTAKFHIVKDENRIKV